MLSFVICCTERNEKQFTVKCLKYGCAYCCQNVAYAIFFADQTQLYKRVLLVVSFVKQCRQFIT